MLGDGEVHVYIRLKKVLPRFRQTGVSGHKAMSSEPKYFSFIEIEISIFRERYWEDMVGRHSVKS